MREIKASEKARGAKRWKSVEAAKRRVEDGKLYLVCRHNAWFRPDGMGYTNLLARDGGWSTTSLVERYAHIMPTGHDPAIRRVWGCPATDTQGNKAVA